MQNLGFFWYFIVPTIIGLFDILTDILYICFENFYNNNLFLACLYCQFVLFFGSLIFYAYFHLKDESSFSLSFFKIVLRSFELSILTELKLAHFLPSLWDLEEDPEFDFNDHLRQKIVTIQEIFHIILQSIPQFSIQMINNCLLGQWNVLSVTSLLFSSIFFLKIIYKIVLTFRNAAEKKSKYQPIYLEF